MSNHSKNKVKGAMRKQRSRDGDNAPKKRNSRQNGGRGGEFTLHVPRNVATVIPDRLVTTLRWWKSVPVNLSAVSTAALRFTPSSALDPDPLGSAKPLGFTELANLYNSYRVLKSMAEAETVNTGDVPITTTLFPSNTDPGASPVPAYVTASRLQAFAVSNTGALKGGPISRLTNSMTTQKMFGNKMIRYDDNFAALVNTVPVNNWYWVVTFYAPAVAPSAAILSFYCEMEVEFYDRANLVQG
jgi:hypothetical protein